MTVIDTPYLLPTQKPCSNITVYENDSPLIPFAPKRIYSVECADSEIRGHHAHKRLWQIFLCTDGEIQLTIKSPEQKWLFNLFVGSSLTICPPGYWRTFTAATTTARLLVLASDAYDENDYIRSWSEYSRWYISLSRSKKYPSEHS